MNILLLAATPPEIQPLISWLQARAERQERNVLYFARCQVTVAFTGLGSMQTAFLFGQHYHGDHPPHLAIQAGIAGAVDARLTIGEVVNVTSECVLDLGAETASGQHLSPADMGFPLGYPYDDSGVLRPLGPSAILPFPAVAGGTVNRTTGSLASVQRLQTQFPNVQVESMEGAGFFYAGMMSGVAVLQLRAISNFVQVRDRESWNVPLAVTNLNAALKRVLEPFLSQV